MILFFSLSTADQRIWLLPSFQAGLVNRTGDVLQCVGGKAVNAARTAVILGGTVKVVSVCNAALTALLRGEGIGVDGVGVDGREPVPSVRRATSVVDLESGEVSELVEEAAALDRATLEQVVERFLAVAKDADVVCLCGSLPAGVPADLYARLVRALPDTRVVIDAQGEPLRVALEAKPWMVKPNRLETERLLGSAADSLADVAAQAAELRRRGARHVAVSCGTDGLVLVGDEGAVRYSPSRVQAVNSTGCGDAVTGGIAYGLAQRMPVREAVGLGVACAAASALTAVPGAFTRGKECELAPRVEELR